MLNTRQLIPRSIVSAALWVAERLDPHASLSYSQDGEDMVLRRLLGPKKVGFYVDVGAHHPFRFSNTNYFYRQGWRGINIDADPDCMAAFERHRPRDINLSLGIGGEEKELTFHRFSEPALNTFDEALATSRLDVPGVRLLERRPVAVRPLADVLKEWVPKGQAIDFLTVDVEGLDEAVLDSNDWSRFRPRFVLVEVLRVPFEELASCAVINKTQCRGYTLVAKTANTAILKDGAP